MFQRALLRLAADNNDAGGVPGLAGAGGAGGKHALFLDENMASFFRRLAWSPDGAWADRVVCRTAYA